jgi:hypothetical protein
MMQLSEKIHKSIRNLFLWPAVADCWSSDDRKVLPPEQNVTHNSLCILENLWPYAVSYFNDISCTQIVS